MFWYTPKKAIKNEKVTWFNYVKQFAQIYPDIPKIMYGKWANMAEKLCPEGQEDIRVTVNSNNQAAASASEHGSLVAKPGQSQGVKVKEQGGEIGGGGRGGDGSGDGDGERDGTETEREEGEETGEEEMSQLVKSLLASGITPKMIKSSLGATKKKGNKKQRGLSLGRGRGRGKGKGKDK